MKKIFWDLFRRVGWIYIVVTILAAVVFAFFPANEGKDFLRAAALFGYAMLFAGPIFLAHRLQHGLARVTQTLPVLQRDAARALWFYAVGAPSGYMVLLMVGTFALQLAVGGAPVVTPVSAILFLLLSGFYFGSVYFLLTLMPGQAAQDPAGQITGSIIGGLWGLSIGGGVFVLSLFTNLDQPGPRQIIALVVGGILTVAGWFQSEKMLLERARPRMGECELVSGPGKSDAIFFKERLSGLYLLWKTAVFQSVKMSLVIVGMMFVVNTVLIAGMRSNSEAVWNWLPQFYFAVIPGLFTAVPWLSTLRHFRTLPVSTPKLTAIIAALFLLPLLTLGVVCATIIYFASGELPIAPWNTLLLLLGAGVLMPGIVLRSASMKSLVIVTMVFMPTAVLFGGFFAKLNVSQAIFIATGLVAAGLALIYFALARASRTYRSNAFVRV